MPKLSFSFIFIAQNFYAFLICSVRAACTAHIIHHTNHSGLCNQINFALSEMFIKDKAIWEAEQDKKCVECLQYMFSRDVLLAPCALLHVFKRCVANTICSAVHVLKRCALNTLCSAVRVFKRCVANTMCSATCVQEMCC